MFIDAHSGVVNVRSISGMLRLHVRTNLIHYETPIDHSIIMHKMFHFCCLSNGSLVL